MRQPRLDTTSQIVNLVQTKVTRRVGVRPRRGSRRAIGLASKECLEARPGQVWDAGQQARAFEIVGFMAPIAVGLEPYRP
jgi:hypothetical protein